MNAPFTTTRRIYQTKEGEVCEASDPKRARLLVAEGSQLSREKAQALGLIDASPEKPKAPEAARKHATRGGD